MLLMMVCSSTIHQFCRLHASNANTMKWWISVSITAHLMYSTRPMLRLHTSPLTRSISCTRLCSSIGRRKPTATHAAVCTPNEVNHISISSPTTKPISISAQRGVLAGRLIRNRIYTIGKHQPAICKRLNSSTCSANSSSSFPICLSHSMVFERLRLC